MERFYERYSVAKDPEAALAHAQRAMIASTSTSSPYYWAGFEMVGGR